jgi:spermidine synthase
VRCLWGVLPAAVLWGASFPVALAALTSPGRDPGKLVGGVYAANTVGAILGAVAFSVFVVRYYGSQQAEIVLIIIAATAAVTSLSFPFRTISLGRVVLLPATVVLALATAWKVPPTPWQLIAYGRDLPKQIGYNDKCLFVGEGMNSSVAVVYDDKQNTNFYVSGKIEASNTPQDMRLQRMLGHIPALVHPNPKSVLVVGCGAGVTAGSFLVHPSIERVVICEIEPLIPKEVATRFRDENHELMKDKRVQIVSDDARHYMLTATEKFDIITSDPIHPWVKGAATLYTKEYFELVKKRLNPGGLVTQWVPLYQSSPEVVKSELATFFATFPDGSVWGNHNEKSPGDYEGYDTVMLGHVGPIQIDVGALEKRFRRDDEKDVVNSLFEVNFISIDQLLGTYACRAADMTDWLKDAEINHDRNLRLQYLAGLSVNTKAEIPIYNEMRRHRKFPSDLFLVPENKMAIFKGWLGFGPKDD